MPLRIGGVLRDRYRIDALLGQGGMGAVYRATDLSFGAPVAIKENRMPTPESQKQFAREAGLLHRLRHPNLPRVTDYFAIPNQGQYLVMDYVAGEDLNQILDRRGAVPEAQALDWISQVLDALEYLHRQSIIHRDVKPANIKITPDAQVFLVDFGLAKVYDPRQMTTIGARGVTPGFAPPEQYGHGRTDSRTDVYSMGATLYALLTGQTPPDALETMMGRARLLPPRQLNAALSTEVDAAILRAMQSRPEDRFATAAEFRRALLAAPTRLMEGSGRTAYPPARAVERPVAPPVEGRRPAATVEPRSVPPPPVREVQSVPAAPAQPRPSRPRRRRSRVGMWVVLGTVIFLLIGVVAIAVVLVSGGALDGWLAVSTPAPPTSPPAGSRTEPTSPPPPPAAVPAAGGLDCRDEWGCVELGPGEPLLLGSSLVLSGPTGPLGVDSQRGIEMAVDERREILGHPLEIASEDSHCSEEGGEAAARRLASDPQIVAVVGPSCSSAARSAIPILCEANLPTISPSSTSPLLTGPDRPPGYRCFLRTAPNDLAQAVTAAEFAYGPLGIRRAATIHDGSVYTQKLQELFAIEFRRLGGEITAQEVSEPGQDDKHPVLEAIAATRPDLIYAPLFAHDAGQVARQARETPGLEEVTLMSADGAFVPEFVAVAGPAARGVFFSSTDVEAYGPTYLGFLRRYEERYGEPPQAPFHAHAYDATVMVLDAVERVAVEEGGRLYIGRRALLDALFETRNFPGLTGLLTCNEHGDCADPKMAIYEIQRADPDAWDPGHGAGHDPQRVWP